jgi:hypothetical protein
MPITKLDVAEREIVAAVRLLFDGGDPIPVYALANAAREITSTLCAKRGVHSIVDWIQEDHPDMARKDIYRLASKHASFFKHADRDPDGVLDDFDPTEADAVLYMACADFINLRGAVVPIEIHAFELWTYAMRDLLSLMGIPDIAELRGIVEAPRSAQIEMGRTMLAWARSNVPAIETMLDKAAT